MFSFVGVVLVCVRRKALCSHNDLATRSKLHTNTKTMAERTLLDDVAEGTVDRKREREIRQIAKEVEAKR